MRRLKRISGMIGLATLLGVAHPWHVSAESRPVGVVASLEGPATVARASTPQPAPLRPIYLRPPAVRPQEPGP